MKKMLMTALAMSAGASFAGIYGDTPDAKHAWAVHDWNRPKPSKVEPAAQIGQPPSDAIVLFDGTKESLDKNWQNGKGEPTGWKYSDEGYFYSAPGWKNGGEIRTKAEFGDCQLHIEYRHDPKQLYTDKGPQMRGNSGVFLMGSSTGHEVQVLESYYTSAELDGKEGFVDNYADGQAGSVYAENPPLVNPARKPGEWQVYDIVFHQPVWEGKKLLHPGSMTVFFNGVLVQDHWELEGLTTHCKRRPLAPYAKKGPLCLQDHGCVVQYRNVWIRPLASRWDNKTHSVMSADENEVMALRRQTALKLYAKVKNPRATDAETVAALAEVVSYANEEPYLGVFKASLEAFRKLANKDKKDVEKVNNAINVLIRNKVVTVELVK